MDEGEPGQPHPVKGHTDCLDPDEVELECLKNYLEALNLSNEELEQSIGEVEGYLRDLDAVLEKDITLTDDDDHSEWRARFECRTVLNRQMAKEKKSLKRKLCEARQSFFQGTYPGQICYELEELNEDELLRLVQQLEELRVDYIKMTRDTEWKLEANAKEFHRFNEMRLLDKANLKQANETFEEMELARVFNPGLVISALCPPGYKGDKNMNNSGKEKSMNMNKVEESAEKPDQDKSTGDPNEQDSKTEGTNDCPNPDQEEKVEVLSGEYEGDQLPITTKED